MGSMANNVMTERVILTAFDSSSQTYRRTCATGRIMPPMRDSTPATYGEEKRVLTVPRGTHNARSTRYPRSHAVFPCLMTPWVSAQGASSAC